MKTWAPEALPGAQLGDARGRQWLIDLAAGFADKPKASVPGTRTNWVETQAVYRFFDQASDDKRRPGWPDLLAPHIAQGKT